MERKERRKKSWQKLQQSYQDARKREQERAKAEREAEKSQKSSVQTPPVQAEPKGTTGMSSQLRTADEYRRWAAEQDKRFEETNPEIARQRALKKRFESEK